MSGRTIGTIAGAVIGFWIGGGPQGAYWGAMIGGMAGGLIDPETLQGAQFSGRSIAGSESGLARAIVFGTHVVEGRLMDGEDEPRLGTRTESAGKGGPEIEHDTALLTYAIEICESSELRGTSVQGVIAVWEDEKLVYDVRPDSLVSAADNAKWMENKSFHFGNEGQAPSAALESIHGVGNVPAYVGTCRMDVVDEDLVLHGERIPRYRFLVSRCPVDPPNFLLVTGSAKFPGYPMYATALASDIPAFVGIEQSTGADASGYPAYYGGTWLVASKNSVRYSTDNRQTWQTGTFTWSPASMEPNDVEGGHDGFSVENKSLSAYDRYQYRADLIPKAFTQIPDRYFSDHRRYAGGYWWWSWGTWLRRAPTMEGPWEVWSTGQQEAGNETKIYVWVDIAARGTLLYATVRDLDDRSSLRVSSDGGVTWPIGLVEVSYEEARGGVPRPYFISIPERDDDWGIVAWNWGSGSVWTSANGFSAPVDTGMSPVYGPVWLPQGGASWMVDGGRRIATANGNVYVIGNDDKAASSTDFGLSWSAPITMPISSAIGIVAGSSQPIVGGGVALPDVPEYYIDPITGGISGPGNNTARMCSADLEEIVRACYRLGAPQITDSMLDLSVLEGTVVMGCAVAELGATAADAIEPLRRTYMFDLPEYDGKIHARWRGGGTDWTIDPSEVIAGEESSLDGKRGLETTFPKSLQLTYVAPTIDYKPTTQTAENVNPDVFTTSEESYQVNISLSDDEAAQVADIMLKVMTTEREDEQKFSLPIEFAGMIPSDILTIEGKRYRVDQMRLEPNRVVVERAVYDRASAYYSNAAGVEGIRRPPPVSSLRGPTVFAVMNAPVLRDADDKAGVYVAAAGLVSGWKGAIIQASRDGVTFENGPQITTSATMGELTAELPSASRYAQDWTNTLSVTLYPLSGELDSVTHEQIIAEANVAAIVYPSGKVEIIQFQSATEIAPRQYELTGLMRGRLDTTPGTHAVGAKFVLLNDAIRFVAIKPDDLGKTLTFRCPALGTDQEANATQTITFDTIESLREWQPYEVTVTPDYADPNGAGYCVHWIGRGRLGTSRMPLHSQWFDCYEVTFSANGQTYKERTTAQALCASYQTLSAALGPAFGWPDVSVRAISRIVTGDDDFSSPPSPPPVTPTPPAISGTGAPASTTPGPNGGYADDAPYPIPEPTVFGSNVIDGGDFADAGDIANWRAADGSALDSRWSIVDGRLCYYGIGTASAFYWPSRRTMALDLVPRYSFTVTADVQSDAGAKAQIGIGRGFSTAGGRLSGMDPGGTLDTGITSTGDIAAAEYGAITSISVTASEARHSYGVTGDLLVVVQIVAACVQASVDGAGPARVYFDNVAMTVTENAPATSPATITNLDFSSGLTGWVQFPPEDIAHSPAPTVSSGEVTFTPVTSYGVHKYLINTDPITDLDTLDKWVKFAAETWSDDPTIYAGIVQNGVSVSFAVSTDGGATYNYTGWANRVERGDWTDREWWMRQPFDTPGVTFHVCVLFKAALGYSAKVRNIAVHVTDNVID